MLQETSESHATSNTAARSNVCSFGALLGNRFMPQEHLRPYNQGLLFKNKMINQLFTEKYEIRQYYSSKQPPPARNRLGD